MTRLQTVGSNQDFHHPCANRVAPAWPTPTEFVNQGNDGDSHTIVTAKTPIGRGCHIEQHWIATATKQDADINESEGPVTTLTAYRMGRVSNSATDREDIASRERLSPLFDHENAFASATPSDFKGAMDVMRRSSRRVRAPIKHMHRKGRI